MKFFASEMLATHLQSGNLQIFKKQRKTTTKATKQQQQQQNRIKFKTMWYVPGKGCTPESFFQQCSFGCFRQNAHSKFSHLFIQMYHIFWHLILYSRDSRLRVAWPAFPRCTREKQKMFEFSLEIAHLLTEQKTNML